MSYIATYCDNCGDLVEQIFTDIRYARPCDLDKLDKELAEIDKHREKLLLEEYYIEEVHVEIGGEG